jgi:hypothetical protein
MMAGRHEGVDIDLKTLFEAVGKYQTGQMDDAELCDLEMTACPGCGSCAGMFTANTMNCLTEALGMGLPGNGTIPAVTAARIRLAKHAGMQVMKAGRGRPLPARHPDGGGLRERDCGGYGARRFDEHGAAPARHRARRGREIVVGDVRRDQPAARRTSSSSVLPGRITSRIWTKRAAFRR